MITNCFHLQGVLVLTRFYLAAISGEIPLNARGEMGICQLQSLKLAWLQATCSVAPVYCELPELEAVTGGRGLWLWA